MQSARGSKYRLNRQCGIGELALAVERSFVKLTLFQHDAREIQKRPMNGRGKGLLPRTPPLPTKYRSGWRPGPTYRALRGVVSAGWGIKVREDEGRIARVRSADSDAECGLMC